MQEYLAELKLFDTIQVLWLWLWEVQNGVDSVERNLRLLRSIVLVIVFELEVCLNVIKHVEAIGWLLSLNLLINQVQS